MKRIKWIVIGLAVIAIIFAVFLSCENGAVDPTEEDIQKLVEAMSIFGEFDFESPPPCVDISESSPYDPEGGTITFTDCFFDGVTVNGSVNMKMAYDPPIFTMTLTGTLNYSGAGAPVSSISFNFTMTIDTTSYPYSIAVSGTITIDGTDFKASGFLDEIYYFMYYYFF